MALFKHAPGRAGRAARARRLRLEVSRLEPREVLSTVVEPVNMSPTVIWPPNGRVVDLVVSGTFVDPGGRLNAGALDYVVSDSEGSFTQGPRPVLFAPGGHVMPWDNGSAVSFEFIVPVQARRLGTDRAGRFYTVGVTDVDNNMNVFVGFATAVVPHDMGHKVGSGNGNQDGNSQGENSQGNSPAVITPIVPAVDTGDHGKRHGNGNGHGKNKD
jgi:hypothetical protein